MTDPRFDGEAMTAYLGGLLAARLDDVMREGRLPAQVADGGVADNGSVRIQVRTRAGHWIAITVAYERTDGG